jgi:hypothetical protein
VQVLQQPPPHTMKVSLILAAVAVLLALCVITPVQALAKGDCIVGKKL